LLDLQRSFQCRAVKMQAIEPARYIYLMKSGW